MIGQGTEPLVGDNELQGDKDWFFSKHISQTDDGWYVNTRDGNIGPFSDCQSAIIELKCYIKYLKHRKVF